MNQTSQFIFNVYHYMLNLRDTMEFVLPNEHTYESYTQRKTILVEGIKEGAALGNFFVQNKEQGDKIIAKIKEMLSDLYDDKSKIIVVNHETKTIRIDHTQHLKIFDYIIGLTESIRDIFFGYVKYAADNNQLEEPISKLAALDDRATRLLIPMLVLRDFFTSFGEFQKVMNESKGKPTPQSNFIVQNEIMKYAGLIRFNRAHCHCTDNRTLDLLDEVNAFIEMTEGRRDRRDGKDFPTLYNELTQKVTAQFNEAMDAWKVFFPTVLDDYKKTEEAKQAAKKA